MMTPTGQSTTCSPPFRSLLTAVYSATLMAVVMTVGFLVLGGGMDESTPASFSPFPRWWITATTLRSSSAADDETAMSTVATPMIADGTTVKSKKNSNSHTSHNTVSNSTYTNQSTHMYDGSIDQHSITTTSSSTASSSSSMPSKLSSFSQYDACSCWNSTATKQCCQRMVMSAHKFGIMLKHQLFDPYRDVIDQSQFFAGRLIPGKQTLDYRHVGMVRHMMVALVSGYLYHKSGRECWVDPFGQDWGEERNADWEYHIENNLGRWPAAFRTNLKPYPPRNGRSICRYLLDESEEIGMKVHMAFSYVRWYSNIVKYFEREKIRTQKLGIPSRTLLVCQEDVSDPQQQEQVFLRMMDWLYPGGHSFTYDPTVSSKFVTANATRAESHATSHDPELRQRLLELAKRHDVEVFDGLFAKLNSHFDCAEALRI